MNEQTWINPTISRIGWGEGEWNGEPDKVQWTDLATGLVCLAKRSHLGNWCGYVGVPPGHPWHGQPYQDAVNAEGDYVDVHGGLTYSDGCMEGPPEQTICHIPEPGSPDHLWWLGFDCGHSHDIVPGMQCGWPALEYVMCTYKPLGYVKAECARLAAQAKAAT